MPRGRKQIPTAIKQLRGSAKKDPQRINANEPKPQQKKTRKPAWITDQHAKDAWKYYSELLDELGVITVADKMAMEQLAVAYANWRRCQADVDQRGAVVMNDKGTPTRNPNDIAARDWYDRTLKLLLEFGLTPSSRTRIHADKPIQAIAAIKPRNLD